jgi:uncharacterized membrane protein YkvA (DUF1232 family)
MTDTQEARPSETESPAKKTAAKKSTRKSPVKKTAAKKSVAKKSAAKKTATTKTSTTTSTAKKSARKASATKAVAKKATGRLSATGLVDRVVSASRVPVETGKGLLQKPMGAGRALLDNARAPSAAVVQAARERATALVSDPGSLRSIADRALHSSSGRTGPIGEVADEFRTLGRLVSAYGRGEYRDIPLDSLIMVVAGLVYVVSPLDLIPDAIPVAGYADDAVAAGFIIRQVHHELEAFRQWEARTTKAR